MTLIHTMNFNKDKTRTILKIQGMDCPDEVRMVEGALKPMPGVCGVQVNLVSENATITHDSSIKASDLIRAIAKAGLVAKAENTQESGKEKTFQDQRSRLISVAVSGILLGVGLILQWTSVKPIALSTGLCLLSIIAGGWFILPKAIGALRRWSLDMNVLMTIAVIGAVFIGQWSEGASVVFLFALSELLESFSVTRARQAIRSLMQLAPETAWLKKGESFSEVPVKSVNVGDVISIKTGTRIPLDGEVIAGSSSVNQAPITGESMPIEKRNGDSVFAGTVNGEGTLEVRVTKIHSDTTLARIVHLIEEAQSQKAPSQRFVDVFAKYYTPAVMLLAIAIWLLPPLVFGGEWNIWTYRALVMLVIACPCALVISTPISIVSGLTALARRGVLIKGGAALEAVGKLTTLATDKTGTITQGCPRVISITSINSKSENEILRIAAAICNYSTHPLSQAVVQYANEQAIVFPHSTNYHSLTGRGAEGEVDGHNYFVGNHRLTHELAVCSEEIERNLAVIEDQALSIIVVGHKPHGNCSGEVLGILAVGDPIRENATAAIKSLRTAGIQEIVMLSGDNQRTVDAIARQVGIDKAYGDLLPDAKVQRIRELMVNQKYTGMIGDGVNDAPAMAAASIGIAMGATGTDTAIEAADMTLVQDDLGKVAEAISLGRRTVHVIKTNIAFALGVKAIFLVLALTGHASLWLAILADTGATLIVIANATRLLHKA